MPTRRLEEPWRGTCTVTLPIVPCTHPEHDPPKHAVFGNGMWEHTCPRCGGVQWFTINRPTY